MRLVESRLVMSVRIGTTLAAVALFLVPGSVPAAEGDARAGEWRHFGNDLAGSRYSPLEQIDRSNFDELEIAWRWTSISQEVAAENKRVKPSQFKAVPLMIDGLLYVATEISQVAALDPATGEVVWQHDPLAWKAGRPANVGFQHRGVAYWENGDDRRIFITTHDRKLVALHAKTGKPIVDFGADGVVDLLPESGELHLARKINKRLLTHSSPPAIAGNTVVVGSIVHDGAVRQKAPPGHVRGFDARTGELKWVFHTIPQGGEYGAETWENESWRKAGHTNVWSMMAVDEELGYVYLPVSTPTNDFYGGHRLGDNLFAESIVCLNAETGERVWHFQAVHHGLWDYDFPTSPNLVDITVDGREIKAIAQVSKQAFTYVLDRVTGEPVWPIEERPVPQSDVPGERTSPTQPFPTKPPPFDRQGVSLDDLVDFTPEIAAEAREIVKSYKIGPLFTPPILPSESQKATLMLPSAGGGANWPGAALDPETQVLYVPSSTNIGGGPMSQPDQSRSDLLYVGSFAGGARGPQGLPLVKPPWGRVTAIDLNRGDHLWMTPNGHGPRSHPALAGLDVGLLGNGSGAPLLTKTLLFVTQRRGRGDDNSARINVFDKASGELLGHVPLPETANGNPVTYLHDGVQYLVVAVGGGPFFGGYSEDAHEIDDEFAERLKVMGRMPGTTPELIAFRLP
jgi:quinoprotein glucose dehydrogenase